MTALRSLCTNLFVSPEAMGQSLLILKSASKDNSKKKKAQTNKQNNKPKRTPNQQKFLGRVVVRLEEEQK